MYRILKKKNNVLTTVFILLMVGLICLTWQNYRNNHPPYSPEINAVLLAAGNNRSQLEKVLKHYSRNPSDSLKLRAAEFLIVNMPGKYAVVYEAPFEYVMAVYMRRDDLEDPQEVDRVFKLGKPIIKEDIKHITADYLMNNIELAFKVWNEQPWGKNVPFDVFCEEILPYRVASEPLENWREKILTSFPKQNRSFKAQPDMTAVEACIIINSQLPRLKLMNGLPKMNYSMIMTTTRGMCDEMSALAVFTMRALGIPVAQECTIKWPRKNVGHTWNSVYDSAGRRFSFMGTEAMPGTPHHGARVPKSKVYRLTYARQNNINAKNVDIPPALRNQCMKDVTEEYVEVFVDPIRRKEKNVVSNFLPIRKKGLVPDSLYKRGLGVVLDPLAEKSSGVEIPVKYSPTNNTGYAWLAVIGEKEWNITGWGKMDAKTICFGSIGREILHLPVYYENGLQTPANYPFWVDDKNHVQIFEPDTAHLRKLPVSKIASFDSTYIKQMQKGVFMGANLSDFSDATEFHIVPTGIDGSFNKVRTGNTNAYRYVRYVPHHSSNGNVAEIIFYGAHGEKLSGKPIGVRNGKDKSVIFDKAFDGDIFTYYESGDKDISWTGLDLGEPKTISEIHYFPRNDSRIYPGHTYELYYWFDRSWRCFDTQTAGVHSLLYFTIPPNALFYLKDLTTGRSSKWFIMDENGKQKWI